MIISVLLFADFILKLYADIPHVANIPVAALSENPVMADHSSGSLTFSAD
ncbi:hypothetical protein [Methanoplanus endosymbiosus]|uniref:Uncharacterized protein n=1 Tax=Methanoplanus endosymbiosus TaxID=33865 RepID=A0A9E7PN58_9EURY|nr:hypothetical protein [Methanoplanus endosymbiosus]UUX91961.1 hypothetical protein L6E24_11425 [Methanoplanus endosymbiosus]